MKYQKSLRALEIAEDYLGRAYTKLPGDVPDSVEKAVKASLRSIRKSRDKIATEHVIERTELNEE